MSTREELAAELEVAFAAYSDGYGGELIRQAISYLKRDADLLAALKWAERALAPFSTEPAEKSGMTMIRKAIAKAEKQSAGEQS